MECTRHVYEDSYIRSEPSPLMFYGRSLVLFVLLEELLSPWWVGVFCCEPPGQLHELDIILQFIRLLNSSGSPVTDSGIIRLYSVITGISFMARAVISATSAPMVIGRRPRVAWLAVHVHCMTSTPSRGGHHYCWLMNINGFWTLTTGQCLDLSGQSTRDVWWGQTCIEGKSCRHGKWICPTNARSPVHYC